MSPFFKGIHSRNRSHPLTPQIEFMVGNIDQFYRFDGCISVIITQCMHELVIYAGVKECQMSHPIPLKPPLQGFKLSKLSFWELAGKSWRPLSGIQEPGVQP